MNGRRTSAGSQTDRPAVSRGRARGRPWRRLVVGVVVAVVAVFLVGVGRTMRLDVVEAGPAIVATEMLGVVAHVGVVRRVPIVERPVAAPIAVVVGAVGVVIIGVGIVGPTVVGAIVTGGA